MTIQIDSVRISGFRGIDNIEISLSRITVLLGQNNAGKTSVIKALQLALGDYSRYLSSEDFHINASDQKVNEIIIDVRLIPVDSISGNRVDSFSGEWSIIFGDSIQLDIDDTEFFILRTVAKADDTIQGKYSIERFTLKGWEIFSIWKNTSIHEKFNKKMESLPFINIDAQRDIHQELKEKSSFISKVLSKVDYNADDTTELELMIARVNAQAIDKSKPLKKLTEHLDELNQSLTSNGSTELTPFPKKVRDLSKQFSIHYGEDVNTSFSMEYHGMGTRSWASILTVKAFIELMQANFEEDVKAFFPIFTAEEPEAHLHPNAQRTLYQQLEKIKGQVIISTHSPYIVAMAELNELRFLQRNNAQTHIYQLRKDFGDDIARKIKREVIHSRDELLFSKAIVLSEGETEEQALPLLFENYLEKSAFELGVNFIGVSGSGNYTPFLILAKDLNIPVFIFSDGEPDIIKKLNKHYTKIFTDVENISDADNIIILDGTDFEGYLLESGFQQLIEQVILDSNDKPVIDNWIKTKHGTSSRRYKTNKPPCTTCNQDIFDSEVRNYDGIEGRKKAISEILDSNKTKYAKIIAESLFNLDKDDLPKKFIQLFKQIKKGI